MLRFDRTALRAATFSLALWVIATSRADAEAPRVRELRVQKAGDTTYFHVRFDPPADYQPPRLTDEMRWWDFRRPDLTRLPQLVPQDGRTGAVYFRLDLSNWQPGAGRKDPVANGLEFVGKVEGKGEAKLLLLYPARTSKKAKAETPKKENGGGSDLVALLRERGAWGEAEVTLDLARAPTIKLPVEWKRLVSEPLRDDDLEGLWAAGQAARFAVLDALAPEFGFYSFARDATARHYRVAAPQLPRADGFRRDWETRRLYELTTGATAITESLALHRLRDRNFRDKGERTVDVGTLRGIEIAEHPWEKMMAGNKPSPEPLAKLVPHDNYYVHFKNIAKFIEAGELIDQWGTTLSRAWEVTSRDYQLKERLERQLCLKSGGLARTFGPAVVRSLAITGSDPYIREGSDVTVIFHVKNRGLFLGAVQPHLEEAKKKYGDKLQATTSERHQVKIESYVAPLREVSLHRAFFDDFILYGNSLAGVQRVIDTARGKLKPLADSLDFQYMRTVFRLEDPLEDGFVFLSDPFIRNLVGPALRIKERRRLEGLASLSMINHAAMLAAWETGRLPAHHNEVMASAGLQAEEVFSPEGAAPFWDGEKKAALSDVYNTIHFATPLIELPIDKVTPTEQAEYENFRREYLGLWRQFFDPIGMRLSVKNREVRWETYILPLIQNTEYNQLRRLVGGGTITVDPAQFSPQTLVQFLGHLSPDAEERRTMTWALPRGVKGLDWLGNWFTVRLDDSPVYGKLVERAVRRELDPDARDNFEEEARLFFQVPLTVGVQIRNPLLFAGVMAALKRELNNLVPDSLDWEAQDPPYKGVTIVQVRARPESQIAEFLSPAAKKEERFTPALYYAVFDGAWYISLREAPIKDLIDRAVARKEAKAKGKAGDHPKVNAALYLSPAAAEKSKGFLYAYLEWEAHRRTMANLATLYALYRCKLVGPESNAEQVHAAALRHFAFIPVSPEGAPFAYEERTDEVTNRRHGSLRRPQLNAGLDADSQLARLLEQFGSIRADFAFREDGINTVLTFQRGGRKK